MSARCGKSLLATFIAMCFSSVFVSPAIAASSGNLLINGGGESGNCIKDWSAVNTVPGWTVTQGSPSVVCYSIGGIQTPAGGGSGGNAFITTGPYGNSALRQVIDVSSAATSIDTGAITYDLSGWLGGYQLNAAQAVVTAVFLDVNGHPLGSPAQLAGDTALARGLETGFIATSATGPVPAGTRKISVLLQFVNSAFLDTNIPTYNNAYADNLSLTLSTAVTAPTLQQPASSVPSFDHVFVVMMENTNYSAVIGDTVDAPFINDLANQGTLLDTYSGVYHPSDQNYMAIAGADTFVQGATYFPDINDPNPNIADELEAASKTWKAYEQGMDTPCNLGKSTTDSYFEPDDEPFVNYTDVSANPARCAAHVLDLTQFFTDLQSASTTPNFAWIAADDYSNGEQSGDGIPLSLQVQNAWLQQTLQPLFNSPAWTQQRSLLILTWDESTTVIPLPAPSPTFLVPPSNNHIAAILVGSPGTVQSGYISNANYNHYSSGRTVEAALGIGNLNNNDRYAQPIKDAFTATAPITAASLSSVMPGVKTGTFVHFDYATPASTLNDGNWIAIDALTLLSPCTLSLAVATATAPNGAGTVSFDTSAFLPGTYSVWYCNSSSLTPLAGPVSLQVGSPLL
jgi:hypothetical protein